MNGLFGNVDNVTSKIRSRRLHLVCYCYRNTDETASAFISWI